MNHAGTTAPRRLAVARPSAARTNRWYLARRIDPNLVLLDNGLAQTPSAHCTDAAQWREGVLARLCSLDWAAVVRDVRPFLEVPDELEAFTPAVVRSMVGRPGI
jgi:hypothetical protein